MYVRRMGGFWGTMFHGSLSAGKVAVAATAGAATGGAGGAIVAGGTTAVSEAKGKPKASSGSPSAQQQAQSSGNVLSQLSSTQLALGVASGLALISALGGRR